MLCILCLTSIDDCIVHNFAAALVLVAKSCEPSEEWERGGFVDRWSELSDCVETAYDRCNEAMQSVLSGQGSLKSQAGTPEQLALSHMIKVLELWKAGGERMSKYEGAEALQQFEEAKKTAESAAAAGCTLGYYGDNVALTPEAQTVLQACVDSAKREIARKQKDTSCQKPA